MFEPRCCYAGAPSFHDLPLTAFVHMCTYSGPIATAVLGCCCTSLRSAVFGTDGGDSDPCARLPPPTSDCTTLWAALCQASGFAEESCWSPIQVARRRIVAERRWRAGAFVRHDLGWRVGAEPVRRAASCDDARELACSDLDVDSGHTYAGDAGPPAVAAPVLARPFSVRLLTSAHTGRPLALTVHESECDEAEDPLSPIAGSTCLLWDVASLSVLDSAAYPHPHSLLPTFVTAPAAEGAADRRATGIHECNHRYFAVVVGRQRNTLLVYEAADVLREPTPTAVEAPTSTATDTTASAPPRLVLEMTDAHARPVTSMHLQGEYLFTVSYDGVMSRRHVGSSSSAGDIPVAATSLAVAPGTGDGTPSPLLNVEWLSMRRHSVRCDGASLRPRCGRGVASAPAAEQSDLCWCSAGQRSDVSCTARCVSAVPALCSGVLVTGTASGTLALVHADTMTLAVSLPSVHDAAITCLRCVVAIEATQCTAPTYRVLTGCRAGVVKLWAVTASRSDSRQVCATPLATLSGHRRYIAVAALDAYCVLTASWEGLRLWCFGDDWDTGRPAAGSVSGSTIGAVVVDTAAAALAVVTQCSVTEMWRSKFN